MRGLNGLSKNPKHFTEYANQVTNIKVEYLDKSEVVKNDVCDAAGIKGTLKLHHVDCISPSQCFTDAPFRKLL